jgi:hypothetical protein
MRTLEHFDLQWALRKTPTRILKFLKEYGPYAVVAGGFIRACVANEPPNDMDIFSNSSITAKLFAELLSDMSDDHTFHTTENAYTINRGPKFPIQIIHRWTYENVEDLVSSFDFTIAKAAFYWNKNTGNWSSICDDRFYSDLAAKRLCYTSPQRNEDAGGSILRVLKFYQRGFRIPLDSLGAVIARLDSGVIHKDNQRPRESEYARIVTGLLREVDPNLDPDHIAHLPSEKGDTSDK